MDKTGDAIGRAAGGGLEAFLLTDARTDGDNDKT